MSRCPFCFKEAGERAWACHHCGEYIEGRSELWLDFLERYKQLPRMLRKVALEDLNPVQLAFFTRLRKRKITLDREGAPPKRRMSARLFKRIERIIAIMTLAVLSFFAGYFFITAKSVYSPQYPFRSQQYDIPVPAAARLVRRVPAWPAALQNPQEDYAMSGSPAEILGFFEHQLVTEGWVKYSDMLGGQHIYVRHNLGLDTRRWGSKWINNRWIGTQWIAVKVAEEGGGFSILDPSQ